MVACVVSSCTWRRGWDSNPRTLAGCRISSAVHSSTLPPLPSGPTYHIQPADERQRHPLQGLRARSTYAHGHVGVNRGLQVFLWYNPQMAILVGILVIIPTVFFVTSVLRFTRTPPSNLVGGLLALLGLVIVGLEVLLIIRIL